MGAPSDQFLHLLWRPPYVFFSYYMEPLGSFLCILYWGPQITFFAYYMGPLRSVSSHTIWGPLSDQFHCSLYGPPPPQISLFACYKDSTSHFTFFTKHMGPPSDQFLRLLYGPRVTIGLVYLLIVRFRVQSSICPLISVSVHTFWGPLSDQFFLLL